MLSAQDDSGKPVDWWFMYKVSRDSQSSRGLRAKGNEYAYFDATMAKQNAAGLVLSTHRIDGRSGALYHTVSQLYTKAVKSNKHAGWFCYNDQYCTSRNCTRKTEKVASSRGHTKGVLALDLSSNAAFWLVQSLPNFPLPGDTWGYPATGYQEAQTFLCITLENADTAKSIAQQMFAVRQPKVFAASDVPEGLKPGDAFVMLMRDTVGPGTRALTQIDHFRSRGGEIFHAIAKNKTWGKDFYNGLVGPTLHACLEVETWEDTKKIPGPRETGGKHKISAMQSVSLEPLGIPYSWSEKVDHAKLAITDRSDPGNKRYVCVGDINFTTAQRNRSGGTVAFHCPSLWASLDKALSSKPEPPAPGQKRKSRRTVRRR